jgi:hypothetical protein
VRGFSPMTARPNKPAPGQRRLSLSIRFGRAWPGVPERERYACLKCISIILASVFSVSSSLGLEAGEQLYPEKKRGVDFDIVSDYSNTTKSYSIVLLVQKRGKLRTLET